MRIEGELGDGFPAAQQSPAACNDTRDCVPRTPCRAKLTTGVVGLAYDNSTSHHANATTKICPYQTSQNVMQNSTAAAVGSACHA